MRPPAKLAHVLRAAIEQLQLSSQAALSAGSKLNRLQNINC